METTDTPDVPRPAAAELRALAARARPDWKPDALDNALNDARAKGISWDVVLTRIGPILGDPEATPHDLTAPEFRKRRPGAPASDEFRKGLAALKKGRT